jgi:hypothetical protein
MADPASDTDLLAPFPPLADPAPVLYQLGTWDVPPDDVLAIVYPDQAEATWWAEQWRQRGIRVIGVLPDGASCTLIYDLRTAPAHPRRTRRD